MIDNKTGNKDTLILILLAGGRNVMLSFYFLLFQVKYNKNLIGSFSKIKLPPIFMRS